MNILEDVIDSTPIVGHAKAAVHYVSGDSEKGKKALYKSTRTTAVIGGGTVGCMMGPGGAVAGALYAGYASDSIASIATEEPQGYIKHGQNLVSDFKHGRDPSKNLIRTGVQIGFDAVSGASITDVSSSNANSMYEVAFTIGGQVLSKSVYMTRGGFAEKVTKSVLKHSTEDYLK